MQTVSRTETAAKILIQELQVFATCCRLDVNTKLAKNPSRMLKTSFYLFMFLKQTRFGIALKCLWANFQLCFLLLYICPH